MAEINPDEGVYLADQDNCAVSLPLAESTGVMSGSTAALTTTRDVMATSVMSEQSGQGHSLNLGVGVDRRPGEKTSSGAR